MLVLQPDCGQAANWRRCCRAHPSGLLPPQPSSHLGVHTLPNDLNVSICMPGSGAWGLCCCCLGHGKKFARSSLLLSLLHTDAPATPPALDSNQSRVRVHSEAANGRRSTLQS